MPHPRDCCCSQSVGVNRLGHAIIWQTGSAYSGSPGQLQSTGFSAGRFYDGQGAGHDLLGRLEFGPTLSNGTRAATGQTLDPRYLNDLDQVAGYLGTASSSALVAGVLTGHDAGGWFPLGANIVLAGLTSGYTDEDGHTARPTAYGWENMGSAAAPRMRPWVAHAVVTSYADFDGTPRTSATWVKQPLKVADLGACGRALQPVFQDDGNPPIWRMNDRLEMVFGDSRMVRNGRVYDLNKLVPEGWRVLRALDIRNDGTILSQP